MEFKKKKISFLPSSDCIAEETPAPIPVQISVSVNKAITSLKNAVRLLHWPFLVPSDKKILIIVWIIIQITPPIYVKKAPNQWIF